MRDAVSELILTTRGAFGVWAARGVVFLVVYTFFLVPAIAFLGPIMRLDRHGVHTQGLVVAVESQDHAKVRYRFEVSGTAYEGSSQPPFTVQVGDTVPITYLPDRPQVSVAGEPQSSDGWWFLPFVLLPGAATFAAFSIVKRVGRSAA